MLQVRGTVEKVQLNTSAAGSIKVVVDYVVWDLTTGAPTVDSPTTRVAAITTATDTDLLFANDANLSHRSKRIEIKNEHASVSNTCKFKRITAGPVTTEGIQFTLLPGESVILNEPGTLFKYTANAEIYAVASGGIDPKTNDFRLSGVSATPIMTADSTTLSTIFLCQYRGNRIALYDGLNWQLATPGAEVSLAVSGRTTDLPFDVFGFLSAGVVTLEFLNWTNATTRATALARQDGVWTKSGDPTRRYLGSVRARSATTFHWVQRGVDLPCKFDLFNADNQNEANFSLIAGTNTWAYTTATWRQAQGSANYQVDVMVGLEDNDMCADLMVSSRNSTISIPRHVGIGFDSTTVLSPSINHGTANTVASIEASQAASIEHRPTVGRHFYAWLEISTATGTCTWIGDDGALRLQSGMAGNWKC
jgi:hypothetical protein